MIVEQAIFGEVKGGHGLRATSGDPAAMADLAARLDLPASAPPGADWSPFASGFPHKDLFVLARTFQDPAATRASMVLVHALIVPLEDIVVASDIRPLFDRLIVTPRAPASVMTLSLQLGDEVPPVVAELQAVAVALTARAPGPVIRQGHEGFDALVASVWGRLWPAVRRNFAFRLSFGPADLVEKPEPVLVCTPPSLAPRWRGYRMVTAPGAQGGSLAADLLSGRGRGKVLGDFARKLGAELASLGDLPLLEQAYRFAVVEPDTIGNAITAVRLAERLSPDPAQGISEKTELLDRLLHHVETAAADDMLPLRNLSLHGFGHAEQLWSGLKRWMSGNAFPPAQDTGFMPMIAYAAEPAESGEHWRRAVLGGLSAAARAQGHAFAEAFWRWTAADPAILRQLLTAIELGHPLENRLVSTAPRALASQAAEPIMDLAREQRLYQLHGVAASASLRPGAAARIQAALEPPPAADGIRLALRKATPGEIVECAIGLADSRVISLAAQSVAKSPSLLADVDMSKDAARKIWSAALGVNASAWRGPADPRAAFDAILVDFLDGGPVIPELIGRLSVTPLGDLTRFARRVEIWQQLAGPARDAMIRATARGWLGAIAAGETFSGPEQEVRTAVLTDPELDKLLGRLASGQIGSAIQVVTALPAFSQDRFRSWFRTAASRTRPIPAADSEAIGHLVRQRRWHLVVGELLGMLRRERDDARPALRACLPMIGFWDRWRLGLSHVSSAEKWQSLERLAANLYPGGPDDNNLWERAGGDNADLATHGNGHARWQNALSQIQRGKGRPRMDKLLREMQREWPRNQELRFLAEDTEFRKEDK